MVGRTAVATRGAMRARNDLRVVQAMGAATQQQWKGGGAVNAGRPAVKMEIEGWTRQQYYSLRGHDRNRTAFERRGYIFWSDFYWRRRKTTDFTNGFN